MKLITRRQLLATGKPFIIDPERTMHIICYPLTNVSYAFEIPAAGIWRDEFFSKDLDSRVDSADWFEAGYEEPQAVFSTVTSSPQTDECSCVSLLSGHEEGCRYRK